MQNQAQRLEAPEPVRAVVGSVRDRSGGKGTRWELRVRHGGIQISRYYRGDETGAGAALDAWLVELADELTVRSTFGDLLEIYYRRRSRRMQSPETIRQRIDDHLKPLAGSWLVVDMDEPMLETLYESLLAKGLGRETVRKIHYIVRPALAMARRYKVIQVNPGDLSLAEILGSGKKYRGKAPKVSELAKIYKLASDRGDVDVCLYIRLAIITGARRGELCGLRWGDIDWSDCSLNIERGVVFVKGEPQLRLKTEDSVRPIALDPGTLSSLAEYRAIVVAGGGGADDDAYVFADFDKALDGSFPRRPTTWTSRWRRLCRRVDVTLRLYDNRHGSLSWQFAAGLNPIDVSRRAGHSRTSTTTDVYGHSVVPEADRKAAAVVGGKFAEIEQAASAGSAAEAPEFSILGRRPKTKQGCSAPCGCDNEAKVKGLCQGHYAQDRAGKELTPLMKYRKNPESCSYPPCPSKATSNSYCNGHDMQRRRGQELRPLRGQPPVDGDGAVPMAS